MIQVFNAGVQPFSGSDVTITVTAVADLSTPLEYVDVAVSGTNVGAVFVLDGSDCPEEPDVADLIIAQDTFNAALADHSLVITLTASSEVNSELCLDGYVAVAVTYFGLTKDCNGNGIPDDCDISDCPIEDLACKDGNDDGIPDGCVIDCNNNGFSDSDDIAEGASADCNANGVPDECDIADAGSKDCQPNGIPDECESIGEVESEWIGDTGFWSTANDWCPNVAPDNKLEASFAVTATGSSSVVTLNISPTLESLNLEAGAIIEVNDTSGANSRTLAVDGTDDHPGILNSGALRATDGRRLVIDAPVIDQGVCGACDSCVGTGVIEALDGGIDNESVVEINGAVVIGGTVHTDGNYSEIHLIGGAELLDVCVDGVVVPDGQSAGFSGDIVNDGLILVADLGDVTASFGPVISGATLSGNGGGDDSVLLGGELVAQLGDFTAGFTNSAGHAIEGAGIVFGDVTNSGEIKANTSCQMLILYPPGDKQSDGDLSATDGGTLWLADSLTGNGTFRAENGILFIEPDGGEIIVTGDSLDVGGGGRAEVNSGSSIVINQNIIVGCFSLARGRTPPVWKVASGGSAEAEGDFLLAGPSELLVEALGIMKVGGNFDNQQSKDGVSSFDFDEGSLIMVAPELPNGGTIPLELEAAGEDRGDVPEGFDDNFALGTLVVSVNTSVDVVDHHDNQSDGTEECEALYVDTLIVETGGVLTTTGCTQIFYNTISNAGEVNTLNVSVFPIPPEVCDGDTNFDGVVDPLDAGFVQARFGCVYPDDGVNCSHADANRDGVVDPLDTGYVLARLGACD